LFVVSVAALKAKRSFGQLPKTTLLSKTDISQGLAKSAIPVVLFSSPKLPPNGNIRSLRS